MEPSYTDSRVVRTIRSLRKIQTNNDSFSTRTSTPSQDAQILEIISNREEIKHMLNSVSSSEFLEVIKNENAIIRDLFTEPVLTQLQVKRLEERLSDYKESVKIKEAKRIMSNKLQERMEAIKKQIAESSNLS